MTEMCFQHCADNFFKRELSTEESTCLDRCVLKFSNVNQRMMDSYVRDQSLINERRLKEMEEQVRANEAALAAAAAAAAPPTVEANPPGGDINLPTVEPETSSKATILKLGEDSGNQSQSQALAT